MKQEFTSVEIEALLPQLRKVFHTVSLQAITNMAQEESLAREGASVEYLLDCHPSVCALTRMIMVDGVPLALRMESELTAQEAAAQTMTPREQQLQQDEMIRDFLTGAYNRRYWETVFCPTIASHAAAGKSVAVALVSIDGYDAIEQKHGALDADQLICYVANQWKKFYDEGDEKVVCRLSKYTFAIGCVGADAVDLENQMRYVYGEMKLVCTATSGMLCKIPFTLSVGCAATGEVCDPSWAQMQILCESRLNGQMQLGGNGVAYAELR